MRSLTFYKEYIIMTIIATAAKSALALFGLVCASIVAIFITLAYSGHGAEIAKVGCAIQTDGVAEYSYCMYEVGASIDD